LVFYFFFFFFDGSIHGRAWEYSVPLIQLINSNRKFLNSLFLKGKSKAMRGLAPLWKPSFFSSDGKVSPPALSFPPPDPFLYVRPTAGQVSCLDTPSSQPEHAPVIPLFPQNNKPKNPFSPSPSPLFCSAKPLKFRHLLQRGGFSFPFKKGEITRIDFAQVSGWNTILPLFFPLPGEEYSPSYCFRGEDPFFLDFRITFFPMYSRNGSPPPPFLEFPPLSWKALRPPVDANLSQFSCSSASAFSPSLFHCFEPFLRGLARLG